MRMYGGGGEGGRGEFSVRSSDSIGESFTGTISVSTSCRIAVLTVADGTPVGTDEPWSGIRSIPTGSECFLGPRTESTDVGVVLGTTGSEAIAGHEAMRTTYYQP